MNGLDELLAKVNSQQICSYCLDQNFSMLINFSSSCFCIDLALLD